MQDVGVVEEVRDKRHGELALRSINVRFRPDRPRVPFPMLRELGIDTQRRMPSARSSPRDRGVRPVHKTALSRDNTVPREKDVKCRPEWTRAMMIETG